MNVKRRHLALILAPALLLMTPQSNAATWGNIFVPGNCTKTQHKSWPWYADSLFKVGFKWVTDQISKSIGGSGYGGYTGGIWNSKLQKCTKKCTGQTGLAGLQQNITTSANQLQWCIQGCMYQNQP